MSDGVNEPLISCICITNKRTKFLARAIQCFNQQNYFNKELLITYPSADKETPLFLNGVIADHPDLLIRLLERQDSESLGGAYNHAVHHSNGEYICLWDDDDWYYETRLSIQYHSLINTRFQASVLMRILLYNEITEKAYLAFHYTWDGSLLCKKEILLANPYANLDKGEDTHIMQFLENRKYLYHIDDQPHLYIYTYHGSNTWNFEHYQYFIDKSEPLDLDVSQKITLLLKLKE